MSSVLVILTACGNATPGVPPPESPQPQPSAEAKVSLSIDPALSPTDSTEDAVSGSGFSTRFLANRLTLAAPSRAAIDAAVQRLGGQLDGDVAQVGESYFATLQLASLPDADLTEVSAALRRLSPGVNTTLAVSSKRAAALLALAAAEKERGDVEVGLDFVLEDSGLADGHTTEAMSADACAWPYMAGAGSVQGFGVCDAWRAMSRTDAFSHRVDLAIFDSGFAHSADMAPNAVLLPVSSAWNQPGVGECNGQPCPWHGTEVSGVLAGTVDDGHGTAGVAGPVVGRLFLVNSPKLTPDALIKYAVGAVQALGTRPRVLNISATTRVPAGLFFATNVLDLLTRGLRFAGILVVAAAGNNGQDVDASDSFAGFSWETGIYVPCELDDVVCVGGLDENSLSRHPSSNYGTKQRGGGSGAVAGSVEDGSVDLYGPYVVNTTPLPVNGVVPEGVLRATGTSFASPFVAGAAALVWSVRPNASANEVFAILMSASIQRSLNEKPWGYRQVAVGSMVKGLIGNLAPTVQITAPTTTTLSPGLPGVTFSATVSDFEDAPEQLNVAWTSNVDGALFTGTSGSFTFATTGPRDVTVTVTDRGGAHSSQTLHVVVQASPLQLHLTQPAGTFVPLNRAVSFTVVNSDAFGTLSSCRWTSLTAADGISQVAGCSVPLQFASAGVRTMRVDAIDGYGQSGSLQFQVEAGQGVAITFPLNNSNLAIPSTTTIAAALSLPGPTASRTWTWQAEALGCPKLSLNLMAPSVMQIGGDWTMLWDTTGLGVRLDDCDRGWGTLELVVVDQQQQVFSDRVRVELYRNGVN
ncbi:MAG: S8 family serine peptidase [Myxococcaceae bacterium]